MLKNVSEASFQPHCGPIMQDILDDLELYTCANDLVATRVALDAIAYTHPKLVRKSILSGLKPSLSEVRLHTDAALREQMHRDIVS